MNPWTNQPNAVNLALTSRLQFEYHWRGVTDSERSAADAKLSRGAAKTEQLSGAVLKL